MSELTVGEVDRESTPAPQVFQDFEQMSPSERQSYSEHLQRSGQMDPPNPDGKAQYASMDPSWQHSSKVVAIARCNPRDKEFELLVFKDGKPYRRWPTSPGLQGYDNVNKFDMRTDLTDSPGGSGGNHVRATSRLHTVTSKSYRGTKMPYAVWIGSKNGFAVHGTPPSNYGKLGKPASHGCLRLRMEHAEEFYNLVNRVGTSNASVYFAGYSCDGEASPQRNKPQLDGFLRKLFPRRD